MPVIFVLFVSDFFDTIGTAVAVSSAGGLLDENGQPPQLKRLLLVDSAAAAGGGAMGVSSVTTYVESGAGVAEGARTGLASVVTAVCFVLTIFFVPLIAVVGQSVGEAGLHPAVAPALIMIGYLMIRLVAEVDWSRPEAGIPAFLVIAGVPLTFSISAGIGFGVLGYVAVMAAHRQGPPGAPADVGARPALPRVLRLGLADEERVLGRAGRRAHAAPRPEAAVVAARFPGAARDRTRTRQYPVGESAWESAVGPRPSHAQAVAWHADDPLQEAHLARRRLRPRARLGLGMLDTGLVLLRHGGRWKTTMSPHYNVTPSIHVVIREDIIVDLEGRRHALRWFSLLLGMPV